MKSQLFRKANHYVPQMYLKRWASSNKMVWTYRTLVSHTNHPEWKLQSLKGIAYHQHLYTRLTDGQESDDLERWFSQKVEGPAEEPLWKATTDARLTADDWRILVRFFAAQDVRTPARFLENVQRWHQSLPQFLEETSKKAVDDCLQARERGELPRRRQSQDGEGLPLRIAPENLADHGTGLNVELLVGRALWLWSMKRAMQLVPVLVQRHWTILAPPRGRTWFTSDNPALRLNYRSASDYSFGGGWDRKGTELVMPLGPHHLLYTQVGNRRPPRRGTMVSEEQARLFRRFLAENAHRLVFSREVDGEVPGLRPRIVDPEVYEKERQLWSTWHQQQTKAERDMMERTPASTAFGTSRPLPS